MAQGLPQKLINEFLDIFEGLTGYVAQISSDHAYIHKGMAFTALIDTGSISSAYHVAFTTPTDASGKYIHWRPIGITSSSNYVDITLKEETSYTIAGGTDVTPINRNRNSTATSAMQSFKAGVTNAGTGTIIDLTGIGSTGGFFSLSGGADGANEELLLKPNTDYVLTITPSGVTTCNLKLFWYDEDGYIAK